jgi:hypothetical protein
MAATQPLSHPRPEQPFAVFPPRRHYSSLSIRDLLDGREAYRVYLSSLENVIATAVGRYYIHEEDWYAKHPPDEHRPKGFPRPSSARTLSNSLLRPWSWPAVLVFVKRWQDEKSLGDDVVPKSLYLPDGRIVPTCVIELAPDDKLPEATVAPLRSSSLLGGGYACLRSHQGMQSYGTISCLVRKGGSYYALTNRHVAGGTGEVVSAMVRGEYEPIGVTSGIAVDRQSMSSVFPRWGSEQAYLTLDAGLVRIDNINYWTAQVFGVGEIGEVFDATENTITLDMIGCPLCGFGATSGASEGQISALFFKYASANGYDYVTDVLIGPRRRNDDKSKVRPITRGGDSGTFWFFDTPAYNREFQLNKDLDHPEVPVEQGVKARRYRPIAMQWGGQREINPDGNTTAYALATFVSTIARALDVEIERNWSLGHDETWGKIGHFSIGWKACDQLSGKIGKLMQANQKNIGYPDSKISDGHGFTVNRKGIVPLADVPDYIWVVMQGTRPFEPIQHFADIDIIDISGGDTLLDRCVADDKNVAASVWKSYFDGFAEKGVGPEEGVLPFRVWQIWDAMVKYLEAGDLQRFVAAGGVMAHYVGDASQPLHCSYMHHGRPPMVKVNGRKYPVPRDSDEFKAFKVTREAQIHSIYEEGMLEVDTAQALADVDTALTSLAALTGKIETGHSAAVQVIQLMHRSQQRLTPDEIIDADEPSLGPTARAKRLWETKKIQHGTVQSLADSVRVLAALWAAAWKQGGGDGVDPNDIEEIDPKTLNDTCRNEDGFLQGLSLDEMVSGGHFEGPGPAVPDSAMTGTGGHGAPKKKASGRKKAAKKKTKKKKGQKRAATKKGKAKKKKK